ncbi:ATP-binding protein [Actinomyces sp. oral taxon 897]|uniref:ATP-binding protein n=1 Tax=Actinomyces sp. oral taxon 897 TaxID=2081702 RepID=UPI0013EBA85D|nr:ATP-binding protein [Actinomyces sp. oral taxon 897]
MTARLTGELTAAATVVLTAAISAVGVVCPVLSLVRYPQVLGTQTWATLAAVVPVLLSPLVPLVVLLVGVGTTRYRPGGLTSGIETLAGWARTTSWLYVLTYLAGSLSLVATFAVDPRTRAALGSAPVLPVLPLLPASYLAVVVWRHPWRLAAGIGAMSVLQVVVRSVVGGEGLTEVLLATSYDVVLAGTCSYPVTCLLARAQCVDQEDASRYASQARTLVAASRLEGQERARRLTHDHVLAALLAVLPSRGLDADQVHQQAHHALDALDPSPDTGPPRDLDQLTGLLAAWCRAHTTPACTWQVDAGPTRRSAGAGDVGAGEAGAGEAGAGPGARPLPPQVLAALREAVLEALRNVECHARGRDAGRRVRALLTVRQVRDGVRVVVRDDGVGFDPADAPQVHLGLRLSVRERMDALPGGWVQVDTAPGRGTRVFLGWAPPRPGYLPAAPEPRRCPPHDGLAVSWGGWATRLLTAAVSLGAWAHAAYWGARSGGWGLLAGCCSAAALTVASLCVTGPPAGGPGRWRIRAAAACVALAPAFFLASWVPAPVMGQDGWPYSYAVVVINLLILRDRSRWAWLALAGTAATTLGVGLVRQLPAVPLLVSLAYQLYDTTVLSGVIALVRRVEAAEGEARHLARLAGLEQEATVARLEEERRLLGRVRDISHPVLRRLRDALVPLEDSLGAQVSRVEAELRDLVRVPRLTALPDLVEAVRRARERGVRVTQIDDAGRAAPTPAAAPGASGTVSGAGGPDPGAGGTVSGAGGMAPGVVGPDPGAVGPRTCPPVPAGLVPAAVRVLDAAQSGDDVLIRLSPPHGACAAVIRRRGHEELVEVPW